MSAGAEHMASGDRPQHGSAAVRVMLGVQLRQLREDARISPDEAAWRIRGSRSKISRLENGRSRFKERDISDLLGLYGVTDLGTMAGMLELAAQANAPTWWARSGGVLPSWFEPYLGLEASATLIRSFDLQFVNGLFQTEAYARAVMLIGTRHPDPGEVSQRVEVRMRRQELLTAARPPRVWSVLDEAAIRRPVGTTAVMREQLEHLVRLAERPNITLQLIPFAAGAHDGAGGAFTVLRFAEPNVPDVVYFEQLAGAQYLDKRAETDRYLDVINRLSATALDPGATTRFLTQAIREMQAS
jgi:transcriptional regulator with XRE-family HTH domain